MTEREQPATGNYYYQGDHVTIAPDDAMMIEQYFIDPSLDQPVTLYSGSSESFPETIASVEVGVFPAEQSSLFGDLPRSIQTRIALDYTGNALHEHVKNAVLFHYNGNPDNPGFLNSKGEFNGTQMTELAVDKSVKIRMFHGEKSLVIWAPSQEMVSEETYRTNQSTLHHFYTVTMHAMNAIARHQVLNTSHPPLYSTLNLCVPAPGYDEERPFNEGYSRAMDRIGGHSYAKERLNEIGLILRNHEAARQRGLRPTHFLVYGESGTGKSTLVESFAEQYGLTLRTVEPEDGLGHYFSQSAEKLANVFQTVIEQRYDGPILLFFDEFDSLAKKDFSNHGEMTKIHNALKRGMDKINKLADGYPIIVAAATNSEPEALEPSLLRSGRLECIPMRYPSTTELGDIWASVMTTYEAEQSALDAKTALYPIAVTDSENGLDISTGLEALQKDNAVFAEDIDILRLIELTKGRSGADIESIFMAIQKKKFIAEISPLGSTTNEKITQADLEAAISEFDFQNPRSGE